MSHMDKKKEFIVYGYWNSESCRRVTTLKVNFILDIKLLIRET